jgi:hypothetical protein
VFGCFIKQKMSSDSRLNEKVKEWSKGNDQDYNDWIKELHKEEIHDMDTLKESAKGRAWADFSFSPVLRTKLDEWVLEENIIPFERQRAKYNVFFWSRTLADPPYYLSTPFEQATFYISSVISTVYGMKMLKKSHSMTKYASTTDPAKQLEYSALARLSSIEKEYAKFMIPSYRRRGLSFIALPILFVMSCKISVFRKGNE